MTIQQPGLQLVAEERARQLFSGYDAAHDDGHTAGEIADAAFMLLYEYTQGPGCVDDDDDPDGWEQALALKMRKADPVKQLQVVAALIVAEIERLQRAQEPR